jgi:hypothetical protein
MDIVFIIIALVVVIASASIFRRPSSKLSRDGLVIAELKKAGSNLSKPHPVEFFLYFPTSDAAERVGDTLRNDGFEVVVGPAAKGVNWLVLAKRLLVPIEAELLAIRRRFEELAGNEGGEYDGWGTPIVH